MVHKRRKRFAAHVVSNLESDHLVNEWSVFRYVVVIVCGGGVVDGAVILSD